MELRLLRHAQVDSTNERALAAIADGTARHGDVHLAEAQTAGRGRLGRSWASAPGEGLYLSVVLLPAVRPHPAALTMAAGLAVLEAAQALGARAARLKWPNDVLAGGAKLAGILVEARGVEPPHAVVGVGLNVLQRAFAPALVAERAVTSLALLGHPHPIDEAAAVLLARLAPRLAEALELPQAVARDYAAALGLVGQLVRVRDGRGTARGRLVALGLEGLELSDERGARTRHLLEHVQALEPED
ncbi:MAG TPA: biotin--[acetyl-CoA-carboxylase] ligase [Planctomycetota bacterium]